MNAMMRPFGLARGTWTALMLTLGCSWCISSAKFASADLSLGPGFEPTIVISPVNPLNIVMARLSNVRVSTDGGTSWSAETVAVVPPGYGAWNVPIPPMPPGIDASVAFDSQGRLFWSYLAKYDTGGFDIFACELDPDNGAIFGGPFQITTTGQTGSYNDKSWLAADSNPTSPFVDRLYLGWSRAGRILASYSSDHGRTWSTPLVVTAASDYGFGVHFAIPPDGDIYLAHQNQALQYGCNGNGTTGRVYVMRSTDGGVSYPQRSLAFVAGRAEVSYNQQNCICPIPGATFWNGSEPWIMADPNVDGAVSVVIADAPGTDLCSGDASDVLIARSSDHGLTWSVPESVSDGAPGTLEFFPTAAIDPVTGLIAVAWYDDRLGEQNPNGSHLLDWRYATSADGGQTFSPSVVLSDGLFDPDTGVWFIRHPNPPPATNWIGEYFGIALFGHTLSTVWTGNGGPGEPQNTIFESVFLQAATPEAGPGVPFSAEIRWSRPDPFATTAVLEYRLARSGPVRLAIYDVAGREVAVLVDAVQDSGDHSVMWDGRGADGTPARTGVFIARLEAGGEVAAEKLVLAR